MKITIDSNTATLTSVTDSRFVKNSDGKYYAYIYGVASGLTVKVTYRKPDGNLIGPINSTYDHDTDDVACYVNEIPSSALTIAGDVGLSIAIYSALFWQASIASYWTAHGVSNSAYDVAGSTSTASDELPAAATTDTAAKVTYNGATAYYVSKQSCTTTPRTTGFIHDSDVITVPDELATETSDTLFAAVNNIVSGATHHDAITVHNNSTFNTANFAGAVAFAGTVSVAGAATFNGASSHAGAATFANTVAVTGVLTASGGLNMDDNTINGLADPVNTTDAASKGYVDNQIDDHVSDILDGTVPITDLDVNGDGDISGDLEVHGSVIIDTNLTVLGSSNLTALTITGDNVDVNDNKLINLAPGTDGTDAVNKTQLDTKQSTSEKNQTNGYAGLGSTGKIASSQMPASAITETFVVATEEAMLALTTAEKGDVAVRSDLKKSFILQTDPYPTLGNWIELQTPTDLVLSVNGEVGAVQLDAPDIPFSGTVSGLSATDVKGAIDEVEARVDTAESDITALEANVAETAGAQVNVIEKIKVNGVERPIVLKAVDIYINFDSITEYGVREIVSQSSPTLERVKRIGSDMLIGSATGLVAAAGIDAGTVTNSFDSVSIFQRSRNVLPDGNVFVRVPKYYIKEEWVLDGATNYHYIWMCQSKLAGYRLPLSFAKEDGSENDCYFIGAYEASLGGDSKLKSITGAVTKVSYSRAQFRTAARLNDGLGAASKYQITDIAEYVDLVQIPMMIEFATKNTQLILRGFVDASYTATHLPLLAETAVNRVILTNTQAAAYRVGQMIDIGTSQGGRQVAQDRQIVSITVDTPVAGQSQIIFDGAAVTTTLTQMVYNVSQKTGQCDAVVASSGSKTANDGKNSCIWRGMENPYGNTYKNIDGVKISNNQTWICLFPSLYNDTASVAGDYASPFVKLSYININANGYCVALGYDPLYPFAKFPTSITGGSSVLYFSDYYYQSTGDRTVFVGGIWNDGSYAGPFYWFLYSSLGYAGLFFGARLSKRP